MVDVFYFRRQGNFAFIKKKLVLEHTVSWVSVLLSCNFKVVEPIRCPAKDMTSSRNSREFFYIEKSACCTYHLNTCNPQWLPDLSVGGREVV